MFKLSRKLQGNGNGNGNEKLQFLGIYILKLDHIDQDGNMPRT